MVESCDLHAGKMNMFLDGTHRTLFEMQSSCSDENNMLGNLLTRKFVDYFWGGTL